MLVAAATSAHCSSHSFLAISFLNRFGLVECHCGPWSLLVPIASLVLLLLQPAVLTQNGARELHTGAPATQLPRCLTSTALICGDGRPRFLQTKEELA
eukprot:786807-Amphidinium_carterae.1